MADPVLELDAANSNVDGTSPGTAMLLVDATTGWGLTAFDAPQPELKLLWTSSIDTDGSRRADPGSYENRTVTASLDCERSTAALLQAQLRILGTKIGKIGREGGTLKVTYPSGNSFIFDLLAGSHNIQFDHAFVLGNLAQVTVSFTALPGARGAEVELGSDTVETTLPVLIKTATGVTGPGGDLHALGRAVVDNDATVNQWWAAWGLENNAGYTFTDSTGSAALFYEAESRTALGGSATAAGSGASGAGSNVMRNTGLLTDYQAILSTQATGGGAHLTHIGTFRVYARMQVPITNTGEVTIAFEWAIGEYLNAAINPQVAISADREGAWLLLDLGLVTVARTGAGTHRWEGRIIAKSTVTGDDIDVDYLMFVPASHGFGTASAILRTPTPSSYLGRDEFTGTTAGNALNARVAPTGGTWATSGDATDLAFSDDLSGENIKRATVSDSSSNVTAGRFAILGTSTYTDVQVEAPIAMSPVPATILGAPYLSVIARYTDTSNYLRGSLWATGSGFTPTWKLAIYGAVGGVLTIASATPPISAPTSGVWYVLRLTAYATGNASVELLDSAKTTVLARADLASTELATGGTLATGKVGVRDHNPTTTAFTRYYDSILVSPPVPDAAIFASQSLEVRHNGVDRENSAGTAWGRVSSYSGSYLRVPPSGQEGRSVRMIVKSTRSDPAAGDPAIDDLSARLFVTPRYLIVPSA